MNSKTLNASSTTRATKALLLSAMAGIIAGAALIFPLPANSDTRVDRPYDWTVTIETQQLTRQFEYQNSQLKPVVKTDIHYYHEHDDANKTHYESMYFHERKALGAQKYHKFELERGDGLCIAVTHKNHDVTMNEYKAAASAIMHIVLDAQVNRNPVVIIKVPADSFNEIKDEMQSAQHCTQLAADSVDHPITTGISLFMQSEPSGQTVTLSYN